MTADWVEEVEAVTIALVQGRTLRAVGDVLGVQWSSRREAFYALAEGQSDPDAGAWAVQLQDLGQWILVVEPYGCFASLPATAEALSRPGRCVSVFWNVNAVMQFHLAEAGRSVRLFDPLFRDSDPGDGPPLPEETGLVWSDAADPRRSAVALLERVTGVRLTREALLHRSRPTWSAAGAARG